MGRSLEARLATLEARVRPLVADTWTPPVFPAGYWEEVISLLQQYGYWESVVRSLPCTCDEETVVC